MCVYIYIYIYIHTKQLAMYIILHVDDFAYLRFSMSSLRVEYYVSTTY